ncbi:BTAD domain-containing putative transcriptional regulator [Microbispora corallina]|uniref:SARP family transcriptional regulator n=2 Tax=Microbispora corallina TaxID=83302 RepID=A0ABQ4FRJ8_9ACTN|nr:BTAD domain-containing putative transcriptional regulator [Microbispora corallina]GIH37452.1 SARP family transcriptional regulator [Microbispora corallina]
METADQRALCQGSSCRLQLLGPVKGWCGGKEVDLGPPLQRAVLCVLAARPGQVVTKDRLINSLWGSRAPVTAEQSIYTYVAGLRRILEPGQGPRRPYTVLVHRSRGYLLRREALETDAEEFERHLQEARWLQAADDLDGSLKTFDLALSMWTGPALCGVPGPFAEVERARLEELRLTAGEERADVLLALGRHHEAATALTTLVGEAPLRERARELLMLAFYRCGRQADALDTYLQLQRLLGQKLGVDPGEALRRRYELILRADPSLDDPITTYVSVAEDRDTDLAPRQLPRATAHFVGRVEELARLRSLLAPGDEGAPQAVIAITGAPGAGKSALAVQAAHAVSGHFPDGRLYANLLGATPGVERLDGLEVLSRFLRALGVGHENVPSQVDEAAATLRDRLEGRRALILLDDAAHIDQVRPLLNLPHGNAVLITSRESFAMADDCVHLVLGGLGRSEAVTVLAKLAGAARIAADPIAAGRLADLCGGLPLALRLAGARLVERPQWTVHDLAVRLEDRRRTLHELESGQTAVRSSLEMSYESLRRSRAAVDRTAARALCRLGVLHVAEVTPDVMAALLDEPVDVAERALNRLSRAHLVEPVASRRFRPHDLVRLFAIELADEQLSAQERSLALIRALGFYGATMHRANHLVDPHRVQPPWPDVPQHPAPLTDAQDAKAWQESERANVIAATMQATSCPDDAVALMGAYLGFSLAWHLYWGGHRNDHLQIGEAALRVAARTGDSTVEALAHNQLSMAFNRLNRAADATVHHEAELRLQRVLGDRFGEMRALGNLSLNYSDLGRYAKGLECAELQLQIAREIGSEVGERHALVMTAIALRGLGDWSSALSLLEEASSLAEQAGDHAHVAMCLGPMASIRSERGDLAAAKSHLERSLVHLREVGYQDAELGRLCQLVEVERLLGDLESARAHALRAERLARELNDPRLGAVAARELEAIREAMAGTNTSPERAAAIMGE